jgi:putative membrane protein
MRIALLMAASLLATTACDNRETPTQQAGAGSTAAPAADAAGAFAETAPSAQEFAQMQAMSDMYELASSNIALKRAAGAPTKEFAQMMVADHTKSTQALKDAIAASGQSLALPTKLDTEHQAQIDILESLNGPDFDREYMSQQMAGHRKALTLLKSYGGNGDVAELRQFAQATIPVVQKHHDWLDNNSPSPGATGGTPGATMESTPAP